MHQLQFLAEDDDASGASEGDGGGGCGSCCGASAGGGRDSSSGCISVGGSGFPAAQVLLGRVYEGIDACCGGGGVGGVRGAWAKALAERLPRSDKGRRAKVLFAAAVASTTTIAATEPEPPPASLSPSPPLAPSRADHVAGSALFHLGRILDLGLGGGAPDPAAAAQCFRKAVARCGHGGAAFSLGYLHEVPYGPKLLFFF